MAIDISGLPSLLKDQYRQIKPEFLSNLLIEDMPFKKYMQVEPGVSDELTFPKMVVNNVLQPGAKDTTNFTTLAAAKARTGKVRPVKVDLRWTPTQMQALVKSFMSHLKREKLTYDDLPFAEWFLPMVSAAAKNDLARTLVWKGVYNNSNSGTVDCFDGLITIASRSATYNASTNPNPGLPTGQIVDSIVGGITLAAAVAEVEKLIDKVPMADLAAYEWALVCDPQIEKLYARGYRADFGTVIYNDSFEKKSPDGAPTVEFVGEVGLAGTGHAFLLPKNTARFIADDESQVDALTVEVADRNVKVFLDFQAGVEFAEIDNVYWYKFRAS
jgi:hypothetical protein